MHWLFSHNLLLLFLYVSCLFVQLVFIALFWLLKSNSEKTLTEKVCSHVYQFICHLIFLFFELSSPGSFLFSFSFVNSFLLLCFIVIFESLECRVCTIRNADYFFSCFILKYSLLAPFLGCNILCIIISFFYFVVSPGFQVLLLPILRRVQSTSYWKLSRYLFL